jgi:hypothetical protein
MAEETIESAPIETPEATTEVEAEIESNGQDEESPTSEESEPEGEIESKPDKDKERSEKDSEERATETAKKQAIELRKVTRELRQLKEQINSRQPDTPKLSDPPEPTLEECDWDSEAFTQKHQEWKVKHDAYIVAADRQAQQQKAQAERQKQQQSEDQKTWNKRQAETIKRIPDYNLQEAYEEVSPTALVDGFLMRSEIGPDILWHLKENPEIVEKINGLDPYAAVEELITLRNTLSNQIKGIKPKAPATKPVTAVKGGGAAPKKEMSIAEALYG